MPGTAMTGPCAEASATSPAASTRFDATSTLRPPCVSMCRPIAGPTMPISSSAAENAPKKKTRETPRSAATGSASTAGR